jgi:hypothetical protein
MPYFYFNHSFYLFKKQVRKRGGKFKASIPGQQTFDDDAGWALPEVEVEEKGSLALGTRHVSTTSTTHAKAIRAAASIAN